MAHGLSQTLHDLPINHRIWVEETATIANGAFRQSSLVEIWPVPAKLRANLAKGSIRDGGSPSYTQSGVDWQVVQRLR